MLKLYYAPNTCALASHKSPMIMDIGEQFQHLLIDLSATGLQQWSQGRVDILDQRRTPDLGLQSFDHLLADRFRDCG